MKWCKFWDITSFSNAKVVTWNQESSSTKFALMGLCQTMKNKGWDKNIRVSAICPSWVNTKMAQNISSLDKLSMTQPEDIAEICSTILKLPTQSVPFEIALNCNYEI